MNRWQCPKCKKIFVPKIKKVRNVYYEAISVTHNHGRVTYACKALPTFYEAAGYDKGIFT